MTEEVFKLGKFGDRDTDKSREGVKKVEDRTPPIPKPLNGEEGANPVIIHPTVQSALQPTFQTAGGRQLLEIEISKIVPNEFQPRRIFNQEKLEELAESIKAHGIIQPLVVVERPNGLYEIVVGERRFRAAKLAELKTVPAFVSSAIPSQTKLELSLIENIQRADLNPIEEAKAFERLHKEFGLPLVEIAKQIGKDDSTISNLMRLLNLPVEIQRGLVEGVISEGQARPLLSLRNLEEMLQMYKIIVRDQMKVRDIENKVREIRQRGIKVKEMFTPDPFLESLENLLRNKLGTRVEVNKGARGGKITIEFFSDEELNNIIRKIA